MSFNDNRVIPVIEREVLEFNYGGEFRHIFAIFSNGRSVKRFNNAYMLVYIRESDIDEILSPVVPEDIPYHLRMYANMFKLISFKMIVIHSLPFNRKTLGRGKGLSRTKEERIRRKTKFIK